LLCPEIFLLKHYSKTKNLASLKYILPSPQTLIPGYGPVSNVYALQGLKLHCNAVALRLVNQSTELSHHENCSETAQRTAFC